MTMKTQKPDTTIYVMTHKACLVPPDPHYTLLQVGCAAIGDDGKKRPDLGYLRDDTGENISAKNIYYSELTGLYWVWKNDHRSDIVGTCHYRRFLLDEKGYVLSADEIEKALAGGCDLITTKLLKLNFSYYDGFSKNHRPGYLDRLSEVLAAEDPKMSAVYEKAVRGNRTYFGNMLIAPKTLYDDYCAWLFGILGKLEEAVVIEEEDSYHRRIFGFISEFLLYVYVLGRGLSVKECKVGLLGEKTEIPEIRRCLAQFFEKRDTAGAREYFLAQRKMRPDLLMEASDVTGELHLCMEVIAIAGAEEETVKNAGSGGRGSGICPIYRAAPTYEKLMEFCRKLNHYTIERLKGTPDPDERAFMEQNGVSAEARAVSEAMFSGLTEGDQSYGSRNCT